MDIADWLQLWAHFLWLSMLSIGGALSTAPEMQRFLVGQQQWLLPAQFNSSIAIAQAAPGPNILFVALIGWNIGMNAGNTLTALLGLLVTMTGILLPSSVLTYWVARWAQRNRELRAIRAFKQGMAPIVIALLLSTAWLLASVNNQDGKQISWGLWSLTLITAFIMLRSKLHILWLLAVGALVGALGWV